MWIAMHHTDSTLTEQSQNDGQKPHTSSKSSVKKKDWEWYKDIIDIKLPLTSIMANKTVTLVSMLIINPLPRAAQRGFDNYCHFILERWSSNWFKRGTGNVHFVFDNGSALATNPKAILREICSTAAAKTTATAAEHDRINVVTATTFYREHGRNSQPIPAVLNVVQTSNSGLYERQQTN